MRTVEIVKRNGRELHSVYTKGEAEEHGISFRSDWKNSEKGDWILADDEFVIQVIASGDSYVRTAIGTYPRGARRLDTTPRDSRWTFDGKRRHISGERSIYVSAGKRYLSPAERTFVLHLATTGSPERAFDFAYSSGYLPYRNAKLAALLRSRKIRLAVMSEIKTAMDNAGLDEEFIADQIKKASDELECIKNVEKKARMRLSISEVVRKVRGIGAKERALPPAGFFKGLLDNREPSKEEKAERMGLDPGKEIKEQRKAPD